MKLFRVNNNAPLPRLLSNLEKISKISALRVDNDYIDSVIGDLNWIQESFYQVLKLKENNTELFYTLFDPGRHYKIEPQKAVDFSDIDFTDFSFSFIDELPQEQFVDPLEKKYQPVYNTFVPERSDDLVLRYIQSIFTIWNAAVRKEIRELQKYCLYTFVNWTTTIDRIDDPCFNYSGVLRFFLDQLMARNYDILKQENNPVPAVFSLFSYNNYLNRIFSSDIFRPNIELYFDFLLKHLYQVVVTGKLAYAENFISRCTDSSWYPSNRGAYSNLHSLLFKRFNDAGVEDPSERLKPIPELGFYRISYIVSIKQLADWTSEFDKYVADVITPVVGSDDELTKQINSVKEFAFASYRFNRLRVIVLEMLSLCLFKGDTATLKHALQYNQPGDSNAFQTNKDIMPVDLPEMLSMLTSKNTMEYDLLSYWDGHHGVEFYLNQLLSVLFYRYSPRRYYGEEDTKASVVAFCKFNLKDDPGAVESLRYQVESLKRYFDVFSKKGALKDEFFNDPERIAKTHELFDKIMATCVETLDNIEKTGPLTDATKENFLTSVVDTYHKYNYLNRLFKRFGDAIAPPAKIESIGINEMMDRTAFMNNWHIPYYGFIENRAKDLAEQENRMAQFALAANREDLTLASDKVKDTLNGFAGKEYIIILRNLHFDMLIGRDKDYVPVYNHPEQEDLIAGFYHGLYKDLPVFGLYDQLFHKEIMVISRGGMVYSEPEAEATPPFTLMQEFKTSFIDFGTDQQHLNEMMEKPPIWIQEQFKGDSEKLSDYLQKKVWIRLFKKIHYGTTPDFKCHIYRVE